MIELITSYRWPTDGYPFATLGVRVEELARRLGASVRDWNVDGLGPARGFGFRAPSGRVFLIEELESSIRYDGACGPTVYADACELASLGVEKLVNEVVTALGLCKSDVASVAGAVAEKHAAALCAQATAGEVKDCL
jgi:hypothetical protein